jgi:hypothetical protein
MAESQQYLTPQEEKSLVEYLPQLCKNGYLLPVKAVMLWQMLAIFHLDL